MIRQYLFSSIYLISVRRLAWLLLCLAPSLLAAQQQKRFLVYDTEDGLSNNSVHAITRTADGMVWLGTQDGLSSFDGNHFNVYKHNEADTGSLSDQFVLSVVEDKKNNLWVGTRSGLNYFNRKTQRFKRFYLDEKEKHIFQLNYGQVLVQQDNRVILKNDDLVMLDAGSGKFQLLQKKNKELVDWLVMPDYSGWAFNNNQDIYFYPDLRQPQKRKVGRHDFPAGKIQSLKQLVLNDSTICLYNFDYLDTLYFFNLRQQTISKKIPVPGSSYEICKAGNKLLLCNANGLYEKDLGSGSNWQLLPSSAQNGLPASGFLSAYADADGNTWLGSSSAGLAVNNPNFELFTSIPTIVPNERINGIAVSGNSLYAGTYSGLYRIKDLSAAGTPVFEKILGNQFVTAVTTDRQNNIWAAVLNGPLLVLSPLGKIKYRVPLPGGYQRETVFQLSTSHTGKILVASSRGFYIADPAGNKRMLLYPDTSRQKLLNNYILSVFEDDEKKIWLAGYHGIDILDAAFTPVQSFASFTDTASFLKRTIITSITQDREGAIWIATIRNGIYRYTGNTHTHFTSNDDLSSDITYNIICDEHNRIWVCTSAGLNVFDRKEKTFRAIPAFDGISKTAFSLGSVAAYKNKLLFGANGKLLIVNAGEYQLKKETLHAFISDVKVNGQSMVTPNNRLTIMPDSKLIQFEFAYSPGFYSGNIIYQYRMQGIDSNWISLPPGSSSISYTGLPYKKLHMQVRAAGSVNTLNNAPVFSLEINARAPFYKRAWFITLIAALLLAAGFALLAVYNKRKYRRQLQALKMEKELQKERSRIGRDLHDNIGAYTSALIAGLNRIKPADTLQHTTILDLKDYGSSIMGLLRETIWMLNAEELTVTAFTDRFINYAMRINKNYPGIDFIFEEDITNDKKLQPAIMLNLFRILQEALQNACKHAAANKINIKVSSNEQLLFTIEDNGKGFDGHAIADHYGIDNMKERAAEAGFSLEIKSGRQEGTAILLTQNTANA